MNRRRAEERYYRKRNRGAEKKVEEGFLDDPALQQVHITRKIIILKIKSPLDNLQIKRGDE